MKNKTKQKSHNTKSMIQQYINLFINCQFMDNVNWVWIVKGQNIKRYQDSLLIGIRRHVRDIRPSCVKFCNVLLLANLVAFEVVVQ